MNYWERQRVKVLAAFSALLFILLALPASASYNVFYANTNFDTQFGPQYGQKILITPIFYSNSLAPLQPRMYSCGLTTDTYPAGFWVSNMLSGRYLFTVQSTPQPTPRIFVIPDGSGNYTLSTADVVLTSAGTGFPSWADITNYIALHGGSGSATNLSPWTTDINAAKHTLTNGQADATFTLPAASVTNFYIALASGQFPLGALTNFSASMTGSNYANASTVVSNNFGRATNLTVVSTSSTATNVFHTYGFADQLANGIWYQTRVDTGTHIRIYTNITGYSLAVDTNAGTYLDNHYEIVNNTNGTPDNWNLAAVAIAYSVDGTNTWDAGGTGLLLSPQPWQTGYGLYYPAIYGDGAGLSNINATVNNLMASGGLAGTLSNKFIHIRSDGMTVNNTNWIQSGGISGGMATITNGGFTVYSTNGAFANVKIFDQLVFTGVNIQVLVHKVVSANTLIGWQLNTADESTFTSTAAYTSNWFLVPALVSLTDFTVGAENRPAKFDSDNSLRFSGIGNQGVVAFHHHDNGTAIQVGIATSALSGLQMGPNGVYWSLNSVGSNFVNAAQWVLPAETLREAMVFATNGTVTFQYGLTNIKGGNLDFRSKAVAVAGFEGNGSGISNVLALTSQTLSNGSLNTNISFDLNGSQYVRMFGPNGGDGYIWHWFSDRLELSNHVSLSWIRFNDGIQLGSGGGSGTTAINLNRNTGDVNATTFTGSAANLTSLPAGQLTGTIDGARINTLLTNGYARTTDPNTFSASQAINGANNFNVGGFIISTNGYQAPTNTVAANSALAMGLSYDVVTSGTLTLGISTFSSVPTSTYSYVNLSITSSGTATFTNHPSIHMSDGLTSRVLSNSCEIAVKIVPRFRTNGAIVPFP